jgi:hypothetical protein
VFKRRSAGAGPLRALARLVLRALRPPGPASLSDAGRFFGFFFMGSASARAGSGAPGATSWRTMSWTLVRKLLRLGIESYGHAAGAGAFFRFVRVGVVLDRVNRRAAAQVTVGRCRG